MLVLQGLRQHMRARDRELQWPVRQRVRPCGGVRQVESAVADWALDHARRLGAKSHAGLVAIGDYFFKGNLRANAGHGMHEVLDHAVGFRVIDIEAVKLAIAHHIDPGGFLRCDDDASGVAQCLCAGGGDQPVGDGIRSNDRCPNTRF